jgi:hypothetical protein
MAAAQSMLSPEYNRTGNKSRTSQLQKKKIEPVTAQIDSNRIKQINSSLEAMAVSPQEPEENYGPLSGTT